MNESTPDESVVEVKQSSFLKSEDGWAIWIGGLLLIVSCALTMLNENEDGSFTNPLKPILSKPGSWTGYNPLPSILISGEKNLIPGLIGVFVTGLIGFGIATKVMGEKVTEFAKGFGLLFILATLSYILAAQKVVKSFNLEYALWALGIGLLISNTIGAPKWAKPALKTELYIKTGLVLLGAEVLLSKLIILGIPGICVAWVVTPIVLITTFWFGQRILKIESPSLNMVISADMSVCGVSAAIATAAACKAKKEELSLAIGLSLSFTVLMMVIMPSIIEATGMSNVLGGAWMGGTIDSTGAVALAGEALGDDALKVAATIKMIQNILIGVVSFFVAVFWVTKIEPQKDSAKPRVTEIWDRFPKFILGFVAASAMFSILYSQVDNGEELVNTIIKGNTKTLRGWFFCIAFVSIGLESNFRKFATYLKGGKPLMLYLAGQSLNLTLTLFMAWLMFEKIFPDAGRLLAQ